MVVGQHVDCSFGCLPAQRFFPTNEDVTIHPGFSERRLHEDANDIALIRLPKLVQTANEDIQVAFSQYLLTYNALINGFSLQNVIQPICLPWKPNTAPSDSNSNEFLIAGWGETQRRGEFHSLLLN